MTESRSDSPNKCGLCQSKAFTPGRFLDDGLPPTDGVFNVCCECGAECTGTDAWDVKDRWYWTGAASVAKGRAAMEAAELDAEWAESQRWDY